MTGIEAHVGMERPELGELVDFHGLKAEIVSVNDDETLDVDLHPTSQFGDWLATVSLSDLRPVSHGNFAVAMLDLDGEEQFRYFRTVNAACAFAASQDGPTTVEGLMD